MRWSTLARAAAIITFVGVVTSGSSAFADKIGIASAVKNDVQASLAGPPKPLATGNDVFANQRIRTGEASTAQLLFLDETSVSVGPRSELVLDRFVFNPERGAGNVVLTTGRGAFRFVTGAQNPTHYTIKTPVATIGVRGTIVEIRNAMINRMMVSIVTLLEERVIGRSNTGQEVTLTQLGLSYVFGADGSIRGPINTHGTTFAYFGDPERLDLPDNRLDLIDALVPRGPQTPGGFRGGPIN
jgi:hypothetical protein